MTNQTNFLTIFLFANFFNDIHSVQDLCAVDLYDSGTQSRHDQMEMVLSSCKQIHKAGLLSSILQSQVFIQGHKCNETSTQNNWSFFS